MHLDKHVTNRDEKHWIGWNDFITHMSNEVRSSQPNINGLVRES